MSYTCRACGEQATLTACEHCGGQGRSQSAIAEIARLRAELDTVKNERDVAIKAIDKAIAIGNGESVRELEYTQAVCGEALANLAARDTAIAELRAALGKLISEVKRELGDSVQLEQADAALTNTEHLAKGAPRHE